MAYPAWTRLASLVNTLIGDINMSEIYLQPKIRNTVTGQTQKIQDLRGVRYTKAQRALAEEVAVSKAAEFTLRFKA